MATAALVIALIGSSITVAANGLTLVESIKVAGRATHHHTTRPLYRHLIKPIAKVVKH